jgi:PAS domain S-box-containing protein
LNSFRVLIVDDHEATRRGIRTLLSLRPDWDICGEATDGIEAVEKATALHPDVILMDISMPRMNGLDATRIIRRDLPDCAVIIVSQNDPSIVSRQAKEVNASGHVGKMELPHELIATLDGILRKKYPQDAAANTDSAAATTAPTNGRAKYRTTETKLLRHADAEERLRLATEAAKLGLWLWYLDEDRVIWENARPYEVFGRDLQEGTISWAEFCAKFVDPADLAAHQRAVAEMLQGDGRYFFRGRIKRRDGATVWIELSGRLERRANGSPWRVLGTLLDITEHKRREQELQEREERLRLAQKAARSGTWDWNFKTNELVTSPELQELFGFLPGESNYGVEALRRVIAPDDLKAVDQALLDAIENHGEYRVEFRITLPDGSLRWIESLAQVHYDEARNPQRVVGVSTNVTQRKKAEERAREVAKEAASATAKFRALFEQSSVFAGIMTPGGVLIDANRLSLGVCGYRSEEVLGKEFWETPWWHGLPEVREKLRAGIQQAAKGEVYRETLPYV